MVELFVGDSCSESVVNVVLIVVGVSIIVVLNDCV